MKNFKDIIGNNILIMDGAMGTLLMEAGVRPEESFDLQNLKRPDLIESVHRKYVEAGVDIIETNTFGANRIKLKDYNSETLVSEINNKAVLNAKKAVGSEVFICGSIGPLGKILKPLGDISFDEAADAFCEQAVALESAGAHCVCIETISDLQEMRAAVIGIRSKTSLPIISSLTYDENELTVFGTPPESAVAVLESLGADVLSANCSTGPESMSKVLKRLLNASVKPIMVMPNAGLPVIENDKAIYKMTPEIFAKFASEFFHMGASIIGGCCGTTPEHIAAVRKKIPKFAEVRRSKPSPIPTKFASRTKVVEVKSGSLVRVGERINPTGRKLLKEDIKASSFTLVREEAKSQSPHADLLDVNVSIPEGDDKNNMANAVHIVSQAVQTPLCIDSSSVVGIESGLKEFCGKALLNSVNGKESSLNAILPLAKKYGAAIIGLALDDSGMPNNVEDRVRIAGNIISRALSFGIKKEDIFIDNLVMTSGIGIEKALEAIKAIPKVQEKFGVKTILGISNSSHGLPNRSRINAIYLELAMAYGLDAAIIDPTDKEIIRAINSRSKDKEKLLKDLVSEVDKSKNMGPAKREDTGPKEIRFNGLNDIKEAVIDGNSNAVRLLTGIALKTIAPQKIIDESLIPGMEIVGERFSKKQYFLPQVLSSAESMAVGFELCKAKIPEGETKSAGKVILATVHGDIHDIGKNIVKMMLENHGFETIDLGKDVPADKIVESAKIHKPNAIALSALLTTTMLEMRTVKEELKAAGLDIPIIVGGAVVTPEYAEKINAVYGSDASQAVKLARKIISEAKHG